MAGLLQKYPTLQDFARNQVGIQGKIEIYWQPIFDWNIYPVAGVNQLLVFTNPQGAGQTAQPVAAAGPKTNADTNLTSAGMLPSPQAFWVDGWELAVDAGSSAVANLFAIQSPNQFGEPATAAVASGEVDVNRILSSGVFSFTIMQKEYYREGPLYRFPPRSHAALDSSVASNSAAAGVGMVGKVKMYAGGKPVRIDPGLGIATTTNFQVQLTWPALVPLVTNNARIGCFMNGWLFRAAQ